MADAAAGEAGGLRGGDGRDAQRARVRGARVPARGAARGVARRGRGRGGPLRALGPPAGARARAPPPPHRRAAAAGRRAQGAPAAGLAAARLLRPARQGDGGRRHGAHAQEPRSVIGLYARFEDNIFVTFYFYVYV